MSSGSYFSKLGSKNLMPGSHRIIRGFQPESTAHGPFVGCRAAKRGSGAEVTAVSRSVTQVNRVTHISDLPRRSAAKPRSTTHVPQNGGNSQIAKRQFIGHAKQKTHFVGGAGLHRGSSVTLRRRQECQLRFAGVDNCQLCRSLSLAASPNAINANDNAQSPRVRYNNSHPQTMPRITFRPGSGSPNKAGSYPYLFNRQPGTVRALLWRSTEPSVLSHPGVSSRAQTPLI